MGARVRIPGCCPGRASAGACWRSAAEARRALQPLAAGCSEGSQARTVTRSRRASASSSSMVQPGHLVAAAAGGVHLPRPVAAAPALPVAAAAPTDLLAASKGAARESTQQPEACCAAKGLDAGRQKMAGGRVTVRCARGRIHRPAARVAVRTACAAAICLIGTITLTFLTRARQLVRSPDSRCYHAPSAARGQHSGAAGSGSAYCACAGS